MKNPKDPLQATVGCRDPFQINCSCHIQNRVNSSIKHFPKLLAYCRSTEKLVEALENFVKDSPEFSEEIGYHLEAAELALKEHNDTFKHLE